MSVALFVSPSGFTNDRSVLESFDTLFVSSSFSLSLFRSRSRSFALALALSLSLSLSRSRSRSFFLALSHTRSVCELGNNYISSDTRAWPLKKNAQLALASSAHTHTIVEKRTRTFFTVRIFLFLFLFFFFFAQRVVHSTYVVPCFNIFSDN